MKFRPQQYLKRNRLSIEKGWKLSRVYCIFHSGVSCLEKSLFIKLSIFLFQVYQEVGLAVLDSMFNGYNACVFAYGHSASGKTYTMMGDEIEPGLTPRICKGLFERMKEKMSNGKIQFNTTIRYACYEANFILKKIENRSHISTYQLNKQYREPFKGWIWGSVIFFMLKGFRYFWEFPRDFFYKATIRFYFFHM